MIRQEEFLEPSGNFAGRLFSFGRSLILKCYTAEEIGAVVGLSKDAIEKEVSLINEDIRSVGKVTFSESDFQAPIYNVWAFGKKMELPIKS